jgi:hypothetical protein
MDWTTKLAQRGIKVLHVDDNNLVLETTKLLDTLFYVSSMNRWRIDRIQEDDYRELGKLKERNILYYYK